MLDPLRIVILHSITAKLSDNLGGLVDPMYRLNTFRDAKPIRGFRTTGWSTRTYSGERRDGKENESKADWLAHLSYLVSCAGLQVLDLLHTDLGRNSIFTVVARPDRSDCFHHGNTPGRTS